MLSGPPILILHLVLMEFDENMSCGKVYTDMAAYLAWRDREIAPGDFLEARGAVTKVEASAASFAGKEGEVLLKER